ncbi:MAG: S-layer protein [Candidatus Bathyarchaeia archaeon]
MSFLILKTKSKKYTILTQILKDPKIALDVLQPLRWKILNELLKKPLCAKDLASILNITVQTASYHLKKLNEDGLIKLVKIVEKRGAIAKYYVAELNALTILFNPILEEVLKSDFESLSRSISFLTPLLEEGKFNAKIIVGSPDIHGEYKSRARCAGYAVDLALFLGSFLPITEDLVTKLDTEVNDKDLEKNLILIGGPKVNMVTLKINEFLPIFFDLSEGSAIISKVSGRIFRGEEEGTIQLIQNPFNLKSKILVLAGNTHIGTRASIVGFIKHLSKVAQGNSWNKDVIAKVVSGIDLDSDGIIDDVEFLE